MFTAAEKTTKPTATVQKQAAGPFFARSHSESFFGGGAEKTLAPSTFIQPKLNVSHPDDPQEKEADSTAQRVMAMHEPVMASADGPPDEIHRQAEEIQAASQPEEIHRQSDEKIHAKHLGAAPSVFRSPEEMLQAKTAVADGEKNIDRKEISVYPTHTLYRAERGPPLNTGPPASSFEQTLQATRGSGSPLPAETRAFMEARFGADFGAVRIHTGETAVQLAQHIQAHAFAYGNDIYFNSGKYAPTSHEGRLLLAHELTHTIQQGASRHVAQPKRPILSRRIQRSETQGHEKQIPEIQAKSALLSRTPAVQHSSLPQIQRASIFDSAKEWALGKISEKVQSTKGYTLLTVLLGKDPITDRVVPRSTENIIKGFMALNDGGEEQFQKMKESGAMAQATGKINAAVASLGISWTYVKGLFSSLWNSFSLNDLSHPLDAAARVISAFMDPIRRIIQFTVTVVSALFEVILRMMGFPVDMVFTLVDNVKKSWNAIKAHPINFFLNILKAIKQGFSQFFDHFPTHLKNGLIDWFFGQLKSVGITRPADLSGKSILKLVMQVLDISMEKMWKKLAAKIGPEKVEKIRGAIDKLEGAWKFIRDVQERGIAAVWEHIQTQLGNLWNTIEAAASKWIQEKIITAVTAKLLSMLDPTGIMAVINSCIGLYRAIQSFVENFKKILAIVNSFVAGIAQIASGNTKAAADAIEGSMARSVPVIISFLTNQVGLGHIGPKMVEIVKSVRTTVDKALDWLVAKAVQAGTWITETVQAGIDRLKKWWSARVDFTGSDNKLHKIYFAGETENAAMTIESRPMSFSQFLEEFMPVGEKGPKPAGRNPLVDKQNAIAQAKIIDDKKKESIPPGVGPTEEAIKEDRQKKEQAKKLALETEISKLSEILKHYFGSGGAKNEITNKGMHQEFAAESDAESLDKNISRGTSPENSSPGPYAHLNERRADGNPGSFFYIRGHLINDNLGGKGKWNNMTPLPGKANTQFELEMESRVKRAVESGATIRINVKANYTRPAPNEAALKKNISAIPDISPTQEETLFNIVSNERHVPESLTMTAKILKKEGDQWQEGDPIVSNTFRVELDQTLKLGSGGYTLRDAPAFKVVNINSGDRAAYATLGMDDAQQTQLINALQKRKMRFGTKDTLISGAKNDANLSETLVDSWYTENGKGVPKKITFGPLGPSMDTTPDVTNTQ